MLLNINQVQKLKNLIEMKNVLIVGAGLCGSLLALRMAQRGFDVTVVEKRQDLREVEQAAGKSINLALSDRGLRGLRTANVDKAAEKLLIPMNGRMIHDDHGKTFFSPYSGRENEYINSVSRSGLNMLLLDEAEQMGNLKIIFDHTCESVDLKNAKATFKDNNTGQITELSADAIIGTDGAGSAVRHAMFDDKKLLFSLSQQWLGHGYKELLIPADENEGFRAYKNALHIWPRGENMVIALPNLDGSFTTTLFLPYKNREYCFENLTTTEKIEEFFHKSFPDVLDLIPDLAEQFLKNPVGVMGTIKCSPWNSYGRTLLMGDAAHAMVPFYGQGMNAAFEDVAVFDEILDDYQEDLIAGNTTWETIMEEYEKVRKINTDAISDLAVDNFDEMMAHTAIEIFQKKRKLETAFEEEFPNDYYSKYSLVTFNEHITYNEAMIKGRAQDKAIFNLFNSEKITDEMPLGEKLELVQTETNRIMEQDEKAFTLKY